MPNIEVDEAAWLASQNLTKVVQQIVAHPEAKKLIQRARKIVDPNAPIPPDPTEPLEAKIGELTKTIEEEKKARLEREAKQEEDGKIAAFKAEWDRQKSALAARGFTDEAIGEIEKHAQTEGIPNLRAAAADWEKLHPPAEPAAPSGFGSFNLFEPSEKEGDEMKKLLETRGESESVLNSMVHKTLQDVRGQRRAA